VFILPDYQGRGLGKWLVATILDYPELRTVGRWALSTEDAHEFYQRFGFTAEQDHQQFMSYRPHQSKIDL
jgi:GNAT superfamily N-acetyltransferase